MVYTLVETTVTEYSLFRTVAVMLPPSETAPLKVTKSPVMQPCAASVTVIMGEPLVAANGPLRTTVERMGVMS